MVPLVVDPQALFAVGSAVIAAGDGLAANLTVLTAGFAAHTGLDAAGAVFGLGYQDAGEGVLQAAAAAVNACRQSGALIQQGAANYSRAEAASTLGGGASALQAPPAQDKMSAPGPPGTWGKGEPPPLLWAVVESFVDDVWPDGDVAGLHAAAARWRGFAGAAGGMRGALNAAKALLDAHQIPEGEKIDDALSQIGDCMGKIGEASGALARALDHFADQVAGAQNHIRDLLHRLGSLSDLGHDVMLIITGDALEEIKKIANDINDVLHDLGREARAAEQGVKLGLQVVDGLVVKLEKYVRREATQFLGDAVGNQVATVFDVFANANEGALKGAVGMALAIGDLDPRWFVLDPHGAAETWTGLGKGLWKGSLVNGVLNPQEFVEANWQQLKGPLHLDDWSTARPGLGFGENAFDVAMFFIPGAGEAGGAAEASGAAARGAEAAVDAERAAGRAVDGIAGVAGPRGALTDIAATGSGLSKDLEGVIGKLPKIEPPPVGGRPVALPAPKPLEVPVEPVPHPPDGLPGAAREPAPGSGPHEPAPAESAPEPPAEPSAAAPALAGGPHDPALAPAGGTHDPASAPAGGPLGPAPSLATHEPPHAPAAIPQDAVPALPDVPHQPVGSPVEGPRGPASVSAQGPHEPVSPAVDAPHEPARPPVSTPHDTEPVPTTSPHEPVPIGSPYEPSSLPVEGPHEPGSTPAVGPHESHSIPATASQLASVPAAAGERVPSTIPQLGEHSSARAPGAPGRSESMPLAAQRSQAAPAATSVPHAPAPVGRTAELPVPGVGPRGLAHDGPPCGPKTPHHDGPHEPGGKGREEHGPADGSDYPSPNDPLQPNDLSALSDYTGSGYRELNDALRSSAVDASQQARIEAIERALQQLPPYDGPVVRGTNLPAEVLAQYRPGEYIIEKGFMSTTMNPVVAQSPAFAGNVEFRVLSSTGRDISAVSLFPSEREVLFPPGTRFLVLDKKVDPVTGRTIIEMIEE